ncbi:hypothetical protein [Haloglomus halophilum]|uniref:hypothetical protein n=1 Tax=Haloglomus halophilum TaxID=2962672 RepID=UPI0020C958D8|nr:hypothetical protein [Haloglomus halophilum]
MSDDDGYVHDPAAFGEDEAEAEAEKGGGPRAAGGTAPGDIPRGDAREFDWRGWVLVVAILFAFVVIPVALYFLPRAQGFVASLGLSLRDAFLVLPLLPAIVLGALAVWATTRP